MQNAFYYNFPAIRGIQAGKEYFISMCPMRIIPKIFLFDEEELQPEIRAQRVLNKSRIPEISSYIVQNPEAYVFSALTASVDGNIEFSPASDQPVHYNLGFIKIPMDAQFIINDGQHRRAAIEAALKERPELGDETISVVFFVDLGLRRSQQMFADLNRYSIRTTKSLSLLYDYRDPYAQMAREIISEVHVFNGLTETEKSTISNRSNKLFTLSGIHNATLDLLQDKNNLDLSSQTALAIEYWNEISKNINEWQLVKKGEVSAAELRKDYIHAHAVVLSAIGKAGRTLIQCYPHDWKAKLGQLKVINWHRNNVQWEGRALIGGKISNSRNNITLMAIELKRSLGLVLSVEEECAEKAYISSKKVGLA
ncbi:DNA sulfur modification protein DndB [Cohnella faecalis]|uniref:DNA sulfur modification protein DndB n=1 Tax=Cohnella faecalis TaxID=2315694 RepID=A0A398CFN5_9BACL|nr:DNA sulfur modification protein DndB [Cohnella faecalis]RIE01533.1 DNA sulfur modification protein DndB [Cohnella faecalis]